MNVNDKVSKTICSGCTACVSACPVNAIKMDFDNLNWHLHPVVDNQLCVNCDKCVKVCPAINDKVQADFEAYGYAVVANDDIRMHSSSGGAFYLLAKKFILDGGYVSGAILCEDLVVRHIVSNCLDDVKRMRDSKYVQSDTSGVYREIRDLLIRNERVLFCGTPCQVAALKNLVGVNNAQGLICIDILCHGVPSPKMFEYYLNENFDKSRIKNILFRNKSHRKGHPGSITFFMDDGSELYSEYFDNSYYDAFLGNLLERESCFDCKYSEFPRVGDISIGDFWGAKTTNTSIDYENGCSLIIINNEKGECFIKRELKRFKTCESYPLETLMSWNRNKRELVPNPRFRDLPHLVEKYNSLRVATDMLLHDKYDVGVFGVTMNPNFGGLLTYWALYRAIEKMGYRTAIIGRPINSDDSKNITHSNRFFAEHCNTIEQLEVRDLPKLNDRVDKFVLGSDQVWNYELFRCWENSLYLDFVRDDKLKIAYGSSFGTDTHPVPHDRKGQVSKYFKAIDYVGVREADAVDILRNDYSVDSTHVMDPVFLVDPKEYSVLSEKSDIRVDQKFVGAYIIEPNSFKLDVVKQISSHLNIGNLNITDGDPVHFEQKSAWFKDREMNVKADATVYDWLKIVINADFVVTDSYHAMCFCIMFNKPFIILQERWGLSRIQSLLNILGLHDRWVKISNTEEFSIRESWLLPLQPYIKNILAGQIETSRCWLSNALQSSKTILSQPEFKAHIDKERVEDYFFFLLRNRKDYVMTVTSCSANTEVMNAIDFKCKLSYTDYSFNKSRAFCMLYDFEKDYLEIRNNDYSEIKYKLHDKELICLADRSSVPFANNIYVFGKERTVKKANPNAGVVISIYSKTQGAIVDSFEVYLENGVAKIKR